MRAEGDARVRVESSAKLELCTDTHIRVRVELSAKLELCAHFCARFARCGCPRAPRRLGRPWPVRGVCQCRLSRNRAVDLCHFVR